MFFEHSGITPALVTEQQVQTNTAMVSHEQETWHLSQLCVTLLLMFFHYNPMSPKLDTQYEHICDAGYIPTTSRQ